jgi:hypothetical protein
MYPGLNSNSNLNPSLYIKPSLVTTCKGTTNSWIQVSQSKFIFLKFMWSQNFMEFMRFLCEGLNSFKIQTRFKWGFAFQVYNSNSIENLNLGPKGKLCHLDLSISMPCLENFEQKKDYVLYFWTWSIWTNWKTHDYLERNRPRPSLRPRQTPLLLLPSL